MAYTLAERVDLVAKRDALRDAIALGATKVRYRDREVNYRTLEEMKTILRDLNRDLDADAGVVRPRRSRQTRFVTSKGLC